MPALCSGTTARAVTDALITDLGFGVIDLGLLAFRSLRFKSVGSSVYLKLSLALALRQFGSVAMKLLCLMPCVHLGTWR